MPKQLQALAHEETMLQQTALRVAVNPPGIRFRAPLVVASEMHRFLVAEQLAQVHVEPEAILLEPQGRNTAPAVAIAAHWLSQHHGPDAMILVMPSDHLIGNEAAFREAIAQAATVAEAGGLVTFGIAPTAASTGYGYIEPGPGAGPVVAVRRFVEKPAAADAERYVRSGYLWNAGIFLFRATAFLEALAIHAPDVAARSALAAHFSVDGALVRPDSVAFGSIPSISIDYAVMERSDRVSVVPVDMGWSDVGSWDALWRVTVPDADGNVVRGAGTLVGCRDSLVRNDGGPFVAALGLENMVVVATGDAILISPRERAEDIRKLVDRIEAEGLELTRTSQDVRRPWGSFRSLGSGAGWQVKRISVKPGAMLSLQKHAQRAETWVVASGVADVIVAGRNSRLSPGDSVFVPLGTEHRLSNPGPEPLELIEVQMGAYLGEDDIVRLSDIYGRTGAAQRRDGA